MEHAVTEVGAEHCRGLVWDISTTSDISKHLDDCFSMAGDISVLVNNAGIPPRKFWGDVDEEEWEKIYSTNLKGLFFLTQAIVKRWEDNPVSDYKKIINISSWINRRIRESAYKKGYYCQRDCSRSSQDFDAVVFHSAGRESLHQSKPYI